MAIIKSENWDGVSAPALPAGWTVDTPLVTATTNSPTSAPNSLVHPVASAFGANVPQATWATQDTNSGNVQVSGTIRFANSGAGATDQDCWVFARASLVAATANWGTLSCYYAGINRNGPSPGFFLTKHISGADTALGLVGATAFADATNYRVLLRCQGNQIQATCQRLSDSFWLNSSGSFVSDPSGSTVAISVLDSSLGPVAGYSGVGFYINNTSGGNVGLDDWLLETSAGISASPSSLVASSGAQAVTLTGSGTNFSTSSSTQFTLSGGTGASIVSQSASSATAAALSINPGTAAGTLTITDTTDGSITTTITVTPPIRAAATFYVSPSGSDANNGTSTATPWQTIGHVNAQTFGPGDQILFQGGQTFSGNLVVQSSGSASAPLIVGSYGTGQATISPGTGIGIQVKDADYVHVQNLIVSGPGVTVSGSTGSTTSTGAGVEVLSTQTQASVGTWRQSIYLSGLTVSGCYNGINVCGFGGAATGPYPVGFNDVRVSACTVHDCLNFGIKVWATNTTIGAPGMENGTGNVCYHKNVYIAGCAVSNIYGDSALTSIHSGDGILAANTNVGLTERCFVQNCAQTAACTAGGPVANWCYASIGYVIQFCESTTQHPAPGGDGGGFDIDGGCSNCIVQYCYSHQNGGTGYICGTYSGCGPTQDNVFRYNISQNDGLATGASAAFRQFGTPLRSIVHNNTFYSGAPTPQPTLLGPTDGSPSPLFYNNIFFCGSGVGLHSGTTGATFLGNLYWFGGSPFSITYLGTTYSSLGAWRAVQETLSTGSVPCGQFADPLLAAAGAGGTLLPAAQVSTLGAYVLRAGSPAIDAGLDLRALFGVDPGPLDLCGHPNRAGVTYDVGACEYGAGALIGAGGAGGPPARVGMQGGIGG